MTKKPSPAAYEVGYRKPPRATQFKKGETGNPRGRPKGSKNFETKVKAVFDRKIVIQDNGKPRRITMADAVLMKLTAKAIAGDMSATRLAIGLLQMTRAESEPSDVFSSEADRSLLLSYLADTAPEPPAKPSRPPRRKGGAQ
jgi:uncharacterized protein DUF5681